ncbi:unnamed protein product [Albugo candida]|uniref:Serine/threonine-protein phosphatase 2A 55 kDa regulatory subunit B n=1 Tax=Albugo candida TaxID=65357 RepID=A0A024GH68_9STRA|nr:unnamed protein product [Albugo candida]|eukprot:CCI45692.1 unnamed protein product [Albugo candida]
MSTSGPEDTQDYDKGVNVDTIKEALSESQELSDWTIAYASGDRSSNNVEAEVISAIEYEPSGRYLATGTKGGRVSIFCREEVTSCENKRFPARKSLYAPFMEFQSHTAEFDYLKSLEIEEKINQIKWCQNSNNAHYLLSTNDKTIKLWKAHERNVREISHYDAGNGNTNGSGLKDGNSSINIPRYWNCNRILATKTKRVYANAHTYHINSIALNSDGETFMSADDLRVNLWSLGISNQSFNIVDIKPNNMEELTEVITAADFHPFHCNIMMYSTSRGAVKLGDMRQAALCDIYSKVYEDLEDPKACNFFSEIIASISDIKFSPDGRYIIARDFLTLKVWDLNMDSRPVQTINIHEHLRPRLGDLYESDCIFDKFECDVSGDGKHFVTGSYNSEFHVYDHNGQRDICISPVPKITQPNRRHSMPHHVLAQQMLEPFCGEGALDVSRKVLQTSWHPLLNEVAIGIRNNLFVYSC